MDLKTAMENAKQILDEESISPTVSYHGIVETGDALTKAVGTLLLNQNLQNMSRQRPREIVQTPLKFRFESTNYSLLCSLLSQIQEKDRPAFLNYALSMVNKSPGCRRTNAFYGSNWDQLSSELPLVAEFSVRNGNKEGFFRVLGEASPLPGHVMLLRHLEEMIALDFSVFTDAEYQQLGLSISWFFKTSIRHWSDYRTRKVERIAWPEIGAVKAEPLFQEIQSAVSGITEQCRKARYLYLKGALLEGLNLEVNQDKSVLEDYLKHFRFSKPLIDCLDAAEKLFHDASNPFMLKSSMGHLRSFLEKLHTEALLRPEVGGSNSSQAITWGSGLVLLIQRGILTKAEEEFASSLYRVISDEGVHPLIAEREFARLARNMVVEYALLFLRKLDKLGLRPA